jgi:hypothetical protein
MPDFYPPLLVAFTLNIFWLLADTFFYGLLFVTELA